MMEKDKSITDLIERLKRILNSDNIKIVDYWEADLCAIGLQDATKLVYISTYRFLKEEALKYDIDLEYNHKTTSLQELSKNEAIDKIVTFFQQN